MSKEQEKPSRKLYVHKTAKRLGLNAVCGVGDERIAKFFAYTYEQLKEMDKDELKEMVWVLSNYAMMLRSEMAMAKSMALAIDASLKDRVFQRTAKIKNGNAEERKFLVLSTDSNLSALHELLIQNQVIATQCEPIIWGLDNHIARLENFIRGYNE